MLNVNINFITDDGHEYSKECYVRSVKDAYDYAATQVAACGGRLNPFKPARIEPVR